MAKLKFSQRLQQDKNFVREVEILQRELTFLALGVDAERIADSWDGVKLNVKAADLVGTPVVATLEATVLSPPVITFSPVQDMTGRELERALAALTRAGLEAARDYDTRSSVSIEAQRALYALRTKK